MNWPRHAAIGAAAGAVAACAPDLVLLTFAWRRVWLPPTHPLVRIHRFLHDPWYVLPVAISVGWASHVIADKFSRHREGP